MKILNTIVIFYLLLIAPCCIDIAMAQTIPASRITDWSQAGMQDSVPVYNNTVDIMNYGGVADGITPNDIPFQNALAALNGQPGTILFPAGDYLFNQSISLRDSTVLKGTGTASKLLFDLSGNTQNMINLQGSIGNTIWNVNQYIHRNDTLLALDNTTGLAIGDWVLLYGNDSSILFSDWAYGSVGQIFRIKDIQGNTLITDIPLRRDYDLTFNARLKRIVPIQGAGIECLYIERKDSTAQQTSNISFNYAVNCWVIGIESFNTNFAHIELSHAAHITLRGNYIHHSWHYGGSGQGYGIATQYTSGDCLIENNIFQHLRHSMLLQSGANGNVFSYNYSTDPNWDEQLLPANSAGDAVCHGNYPYLNLFEGNIVQNIVVDDSHGSNGPLNTFFRNRAQLWGIFMNTTTPTDSMNYIGNEVTNTSVPYGNYSLSGIGHYQFGNNIKGTINPANTTALSESSLYLNGAPAFWTASLSFPPIGTPYPYNTIDNPAKMRYGNNDYTDCTLNPHFQTSSVLNTTAGNSINIYPNPAGDILYIVVKKYLEGNYCLYDALGRKVLSGTFSGNRSSLSLTELNPGLYTLVINTGADKIYSGEIIKK